MKKRLIGFVLTFAVLLGCVAALPPVLQMTLPAVYGESYYAALQDKQMILRDTPSENGRVILLGGSGVAFSVNSALLEREIGRPVVNFGLYAAFGSRYIFDLAAEEIHAGDLVILCPELSSQTCSLYFGADAFLQASENAPALLKGLRPSDLPKIYAAFPDYIVKKLGFLAENKEIRPDGVYKRSAFDDRGDLVFPRTENRMEGYYQKGSEPDITPAIFSEDFLDYLNRYAAKLEKKGAKALFAFPFMNALSTANTEKEQAALTAFLQEKLDFPLLAGFDGRVMDAGYFYDSNYHTNDAGTVAATVTLARDIKRYYGDMTPPVTAVPDPLPLGGQEGEERQSEDGCYRYRLRDGNATLLAVQATAAAAKTLTLPAEIDGYPLTALAAGSLRDLAAESIFLPATVESLGGGLFAGCANLREVHIARDTDLPAVGDDLLDGADAREELKIFVSPKLYGDYTTDYFWLAYSRNLQKEETEK